MGGAETFDNPAEMKFDSTGRLVLADLNPGRILVSTGDVPQTLFNLPDGNVSSVAVDGEGRIFSVAADGIIRIHNSNGDLIDPAFATGLGDWAKFEFASGGPLGTDLCVVATNGWLIRFDSKGNPTVLGTGFAVSAARDLVFSPDKALFMAINDGTILRIAPVPGNLNGDGQVGVEDLLILLANWGPCGDCEECLADLNGDCAVGVADLLILLGNWG